MEDKDQTTPPPIIDQLKEYAETRLKLAKYQAIEGGTTIAAGLIADVATILSTALAVIFASITLGYYLGDVLASDWKGFGIVAILYLIFAVAIKFNKKRLEGPIGNSIIRKIFKN